MFLWKTAHLPVTGPAINTSGQLINMNVTSSLVLQSTCSLTYYFNFSFVNKNSSQSIPSTTFYISRSRTVTMPENKSLYLQFRWKVTSWTPCSKTCGTGEQTRRMMCHQRISFDQYQEISSSQCDSNKLPSVSQLTRTCNKILCKAEWKTESQWSAVRI